MEIWRDIPGYERCYQVSNWGNIRSLDRTIFIQGRPNRRLKGCMLRQKNNRGYLYVELSFEGKSRTTSVHRSVMEGFISRGKGLEVNHIDGNKLNNKLENLEWCNRKENIEHSIRTGLKKDYGEKAGKAKLTNDQVREIRAMLNYEKRKHPYDREIAAIYGVTRKTISNIRTNKTYKSQIID